MFRKVFITAALILAIVVIAPAETWEFDKVHSNIGFAVRHLVISKTTGEFEDYTGTVTFDGKNVESGSVDVTIKVASINTDNDKRDNHLRSGDFFDIEKFPTLTFKSKKIMKGDGDYFKIVGDLTIKDVTKEVTLDAEFYGAVTTMGQTRAGFSASTTINRQEFNVSFDNKLQDGSLIVGNDVEIKLEIELIKQEN